MNIEWRPKSGKLILIPEADKGEWFSTDEAKQKINSSQAALIDELIKNLFCKLFMQAGQAFSYKNSEIQLLLSFF